MHSIDELNELDSSVDTIIVDNNACSDKSFIVLNLTRFANLRVFEVGDHSFVYVEEVHLIGLSNLERVVIGEKSFMIDMVKKENKDYSDYHFYLRDCESLTELKIGRYSFTNYTVCEIENVDRLEVIEMGDLSKESWNFCYASLELKSRCNGMK